MSHGRPLQSLGVSKLKVGMYTIQHEKMGGVLASKHTPGCCGHLVFQARRDILWIAYCWLHHFCNGCCLRAERGHQKMRFAHILIKLAIVICPFLFQGVYAHQCDSILDAKLLDQSSIKDQASADSAKSYSQCTKQSGSSGSSANLGVDGLSVGGSFKSATSSEQCAKTTSADASDYFRYQAQKGLKESAVQAWRDCMLKSENLQCWLEPNQAEDSVTLHLSWKNGSVRVPKVRSSQIINGFNAADMSRVVFQQDTPLYYGEQTHFVKRESEAKPVKIAVNAVLDDRIVYECSVGVPSILDSLRDPPGLSPQIVGSLLKECESVRHRTKLILQAASAPADILACAREAMQNNRTAPKSCEGLLSDNIKKKLYEDALGRYRATRSLHDAARGIAERLGPRYATQCEIEGY